MIRNFKGLFLALLAISAFSAVTSSGASASSSIFHSAVPYTKSTGTSEDSHIYTRGILQVTCSHAEFESTVEGKTTDTIEIAAHYTTSTCTGPLNTQVHIDFITSGCGLHLTGTAVKTAQVKLICAEPGGSVTLTPTNADGNSLCTVHLPPQTVGGHLVFTNIQHNGISSTTAQATMSNIASTRTGSSLCGPENHAAGTILGNTTTTGYEDNSGEEGNQVAIEVT